MTKYYCSRHGATHTYGCAYCFNEHHSDLIEAPEAAATAPNEIAEALMEVEAEIAKAKSNWPQFNSAHEGFAVLLEEVDELKAHVWTAQKRRDLVAMRKEAMQVAAMAVRFMTEVCDETTGRK